MARKEATAYYSIVDCQFGPSAAFGGGSTGSAAQPRQSSYWERTLRRWIDALCRSFNTFRPMQGRDRLMNLC